MFKRYLFIIFIISLVSTVTACKNVSKPQSFKPKVVVTTEAIADTVSIIGGDFATVSTIMNAGNDPHTYNASEYDVIKIADSNLVLYNGAYLEGKLQEVFTKINHSIPTVPISSGLDNDTLIPSGSLLNKYNPHFWMNVRLWMKSVSYITDTLVKISPINERIYRRNEELYLMKLSDLHNYIRKETEKIPNDRRILITVHDSMDYFGREYGFRTAALQGADTDYEISSADIARISEFIRTNNIKTIFTEIAVPRRNMLTLQAALKSSGYDVQIGGILYSDTIYGSGDNASYINMMTYNIDTIVKALTDNRIYGAAE